MAAGQYPYLPVLDDILENARVENQLPIGTVEIPLALVVGTKTAGRTAAFASNFLPLLSPKTEFANKWVSLCQAHVDEGIRDPIRCFEYLGRFYVQEGNKRVRRVENTSTRIRSRPMSPALCPNTATAPSSSSIMSLWNTTRFASCIP